MKGKAKIEYPVIDRVLEEISILDKINRQWKGGGDIRISVLKHTRSTPDKTQEISD